MKVSTFGTKISDDAINFSNDRFINKKRIVEISPFSFVNQENISFLSDQINLIGTNKYLNEMVKIDLQKSALKELKEAETDYIIVDNICARLNIREFVFKDNTKYRITDNAIVRENIENIRNLIEKNTNKVICEEQVINPLNWSDDILEEEIRYYVEELKKVFEKDKIILIAAPLVNQYVTKNNKIDILKNQTLIYKYNLLFEKCNLLFRKYINCKNIEISTIVIGDERILEASMFHYSLSFYQFIIESIEILQDLKYEEKAKVLYEKYQNITNILIEEAKLTDLTNIFSKKVNGRKIILIGESLVFENIINKKYGLNIFRQFSSLEINEYIDFELYLKGISSLTNEYVFVVLISTVETKILGLLWKYGYCKDQDVFVPQHILFKLDKFCGVYNDYFSNYVETKTPITVELLGVGNYISAGKIINSENIRLSTSNSSKCVLSDKIIVKGGFSIKLFDEGDVIIEENVKIKNNVHFRVAFYNCTTIKKNCCIEENVILFNGDGHAIFDLHSGKNINTNLSNSKPNKHIIYIEENVHIGENSFILDGAVIKKDSIVRENTLINKVFKKSGILAGQPARLILGED